MALLEISGVSKRFGGVAALSGVGLEVSEGRMVSLIGPNGAGKTTLFDVISGHQRPDQGSVKLDGRQLLGLAPDRVARAGVGRTFQNGRVFPHLTVRDNVMVGAHSRLRSARWRVPIVGPAAELVLALARPAAEHSAMAREADSLLAVFGDRLLPRQSQLALSLSYANRRRLEIARALAAHPRVLLLDEPTAGMNPTETEEMLGVIRGLKQSGLTVLLIEHKLSLVMALSDYVVVLDDGRVISEGEPREVRNDPAVIEAYLGHHLVGEGADHETLAAANA